MRGSDVRDVRRSFSVHGHQRVLELLKKRGFRLQKEEVRLSAAEHGRGVMLDFLGSWKGRKFVVEVKVAQKLADWLFHWMSYPILVLQAARRLEGWEPLLAVYVDAIDRRIVQRLKNQISLYAPELWWMVADEPGNVVAHLPSGDEEEMGDQRGRKHARESPSLARLGWFSQASPKPRLSYSDLDQWLLKVLLFARLQAEGWGGPRGPIQNLAQLAKLAAVSPPLVYRWAAAVERSGYLSKRMGRVPVLVNADALLAEWRGRYRVSDNSAIACESVFGEHLDEAFYTEFLNRVRQLPDNAPPCALSGHQACRLYRLKHSRARSVHLYFSGEPSSLLKRLQLVESRNPSAPIMLLQPKHRRSVFGGMVRVDGVPVCDILQVYVDLYHLQDRGREQADFLYDRMLSPLVRAASEPFDAV